MKPDKKMILEDMQQANQQASLVRWAYCEADQKEYETCSYAFFPGCQLGAAEPEIVIKTYDSIRFQHPNTAMFLQCCGFAASMAGDSNSFHTVLDDIREKWAALGKPTMIMACPVCQSIFQKQLADLSVISLYELLQDMGVSGGCHSEDYVIVHPDAAQEKIREAVETLAQDMGVKLHTEQEGGDYPYLVYSINQRDMLKRQGKDAVHVLELIFGMGDSNLHMEHEHTHEHEEMGPHESQGAQPEETEPASASQAESEIKSAPLPTLEQRWENRLELKRMLLEFFWNE